MSEFARYASSLGARVEEVSLGRYLRNENPVLPTPESCRELAKALDRHPTEVLLEAGYLSPEDFYFVPSVGVTAESLREQIRVIDSYTYVPPPIRAQMKKSLHLQLMQMSGSDRQVSRPHTPRSARVPARPVANRLPAQATDKSKA